MPHRIWVIEHWTLGIASALIFFLDRFLKFYAYNLPPGKVFSFFPGLQFSYANNPALFFSPVWRFIPYLALLILLTIFGFWAWNLFVNSKSKIKNSFHTHAPLLLILLGGGSNVFDRLIYGGVIDYILLLNRATANLADGLILIGLYLLFTKIKNPQSS